MTKKKPVALSNSKVRATLAPASGVRASSASNSKVSSAKATPQSADQSKTPPIKSSSKSSLNSSLNSQAKSQLNSSSISSTAQALPLPKETLLQIHDLMVKSRKLEERLIQVYKKGEAYFWIGGPGEEAFGVALGMLAKVGQGPEFDYFHLHYRCTPTLIALGLDMKDSLRLIMNRASDPSTGGRNFANHYCFPKWNVLPVSSPIEVQYGTAIGTGIAQRRRKNDAVSIVTGGDAGTAEGDFASCLIWASRPGFELPIYMTVQNNRWGISTDYESQHGEEFIADRGKAFKIKTNVYNGNDVVEAFLGIQQDLKYIREERKPVLSEFKVSRLYGHSSASGANKLADQCCIVDFESKLLAWKLITPDQIQALHQKYEEEARVAADEVREELPPTADTLWDHTYVDNENADWRKF